MFGTVKLRFADLADASLYNIITGHLFEDNIRRDVLSIHFKGIQLYKELINERLRKKLTISIWTPLKNARFKRIKTSTTKAEYVADSKLHQLERHCNLLRTIAVLSTIVIR